MKIGIIGAGMIGSTTARLFVKAGHEVAISNSRGPGSLRGLVAELGPQAHAMTVADAARGCVATPRSRFTVPATPHFQNVARVALISSIRAVR